MPLLVRTDISVSSATRCLHARLLGRASDSLSRLLTSWIRIDPDHLINLDLDAPLTR